MPKGRGFLGCSQRTRHATPKGERRDRLTRALVAWLSPPLHRRRFPQALRYVDSLAHGEPERPSSPALKGGVFWRRKIRKTFWSSKASVPGSVRGGRLIAISSQHLFRSPLWRPRSSRACCSMVGCPLRAVKCRLDEQVGR